MLASDFRPLTADLFPFVVAHPRPILCIAGIVFKPRSDEQGRPVWHGGDGRVVTLNRLDDLMDAEVAISFLPTFPIAE